MSEKYKLSIWALTACLLTGCGAGETGVMENAAPESQIATDAEAAAGDAKNATDTTAPSTEAATTSVSESSGASMEASSQEVAAVPKEIIIDFTGISEFHPEQENTQPYSLKILSETNNNVTMAYEWYNASGDIDLPMIGENWDCFYDENYTYQWNDGKLSIFDGENCLYVLEYPTDKWYVNGNNARLENGIFYGASVMNGYAQPDTCFMFAYDLENEKLLWRSADQTYNSMNFLIKGDVIFCGYGFTAEDDYLYQLDKNTGEVIDRLLLKKMSDLMVEKDDKLYIHTYSYDYVIEVQ